MTSTRSLQGSEAREFPTVLADCLAVLAPMDGRFCVIGGLASAVYGRPRHTKDIDLYCTPADAPTFLELLEAAGFATEETNPHWIFKAFRDDVQIDLIFKTKGDILLDDEMLRRVRHEVFDGVTLPVAPAEDLVVMKAIADAEETHNHWHDALALLRSADLDWDYLLRRAKVSPQRVLSLLHYALSTDIPVPLRSVRQLQASIEETWG